MSAAVARVAFAADHPLMVGYVQHCRGLTVSDRALRDRLRLARRFLEVHPNLDVWMARPLPARLTDLRRIRAWPLLCYAILSRRVAVDLDLLVAKDLGGFGATAERLFPADYEAARSAAGRLGWTPGWTNAVLRESLAVVCAWRGRTMTELTAADIAAFDDAVAASTVATVWTRRAYRARLHSLQQLLFELRVLDAPPQRRGRAGSVAERLHAVPAPEIRRAMLRYLDTRAAVLRPTTISSLCDSLIVFGEFLGAAHPEITSVRQLERGHIEAFLRHNATRPWRGRLARSQPVAASVVHATVLAVRNFLDDITLWGWAERPCRQLLFAADVPRLERALPRALAPDHDAALMTAVAALEDPFARCGLVVLRGAGLRLGELLDLELDSVADYGPAGSWLRVPLGKLGTERSVPLDADTLAALDDWAGHRGQQRGLPHPRDGRPTDFLFTERGRRLGPWRIRKALKRAVAEAGLTGPDGAPLRVVPHQLRHTYATRLANAGMTLQALMALLGHVTPEMTLRYAALASPTVRAAYDDAIAKARPRLPLLGAPAAPLPSRIDWLHAEMLKTRVAHGYCSRHLAQDACPYANICEQCDNFVPTAESAAVLRAQLADVEALRADAEQRSWSSETQRHQRVAQHLHRHLNKLPDPTRNA
jgi:integrase